jgi:hypothetical protein
MKYRNNKPALPDIHRPMDWQDRVVIWGSVVTGAVCLAIVVRGR